MSNSIVADVLALSPVYFKETLRRGQPAKVECIDIDNQTYAISRGPLTVVSLEDEWFDDVRDPERVVQALCANISFRPDIFTFWQRLPDLVPKYSYPMELEQIAVLPIQTYHHWLNHQIKSRVRNLIRKSEKDSIKVRETAYDDEFVRGMAAIFNESPVRQGRRFWHYGKDFVTIKQQFSRYIHRELMIGAYCEGEMIGFMMLADAGGFALTGQIISSLKHRDKAPNNALIAKAVEVCANRKLGHLCYLFWSDDSLAEFKRRCGFLKTPVPRYFVPLTTKGRLCLRFGAHRGWKAMVPKHVRAPFKRIRRFWYGIRNRGREG